MSAPSPALDRDLYCLTCGYNLRGLSGDPVRCPECGNLNPIGDVELPAPIIARQLQRMETAPAHCVGATLLAAPLQFLFWSVGGHPPCVGIIAFIVPLFWIFSALRFRESCQGRLGWARALLWYHLWGLFLIGSTIGGFAGLFWLALRYGQRISRGLPSGDLLTALAVLVLYVPALCWWVPRLYRLARGPLLPLQREVAVRIAHDEVRRRLAREQRGLWG